jgi:hypothetical protein
VPKGHAQDDRPDERQVAYLKHLRTTSGLPEALETAAVFQWEMSMEQAGKDSVAVASQQSSWEWTKLIRKLRWIGLDDEARRLEMAVRTLPPEERGTVSIGPFSTD